MREYQPPPARPSVTAGRMRWRERAVAAERKPAEQIGKDVEERQPEHELRRRDGDEGEHHGDLVGRRGPRRAAA